MNNYYRTNELLKVAQQSHSHKSDCTKIIRLKVSTVGNESRWLNISEDELRDIANIVHKRDNKEITT